MADVPWGVVTPITAVVISIITTIGTNWFNRGRESQKVDGLKVAQDKLSGEFEEHCNNLDIHTDSRLTEAQENLLTQKFVNADIRMESKFNETMIRFDQVQENLRQLDAKIDRSLAVASSLSSEIHGEVEKLQAKIEGNRVKT